LFGEFVLVRSFPLLRSFGMISSKEETRLETISVSVEESQSLALIGKMRKGGKKGGPRGLGRRRIQVS
jgi:hypothetical protein